jgi:N-methylhydantoinase A
LKVAIDVGGTFTDAIAYGEGIGWRIAKVPTTSDDLSRGFLEAFGAASGEEEIELLLHGTTVVINAVLTGHYPDAALVTTGGFRDVLEIMRADRKDLFDLTQRKPAPMIPRPRRFEAAERIAADGSIVTELTDAEIERIVDEVEASGSESVAVCFLFAFLNPVHEQRLGAAIARRLPDLHVSLSHEVLPVYREFERTSTTVVNAVAQPLMDRYLRKVEARLAESSYQGQFLIMQSNGGLASPREARETPVTTLFSGPAGGVVAAGHAGAAAGFEKVMNLDMGGTSCDVSAVTRGEPDRVMSFEVAGYPVSVSSIDIVTVGAGGGSIVFVDEGGGLRVGPDSAGAQPGPACYGRGGTRPTVTDASVVLGRYGADIALGGSMSIDVDLAREAVQTVADPLGMTLEEAAAGIIRLVNVNMADALRQVSLERGRDPRDYALIGAGGAGGAHVAEVARELGIPNVVMPPFPGAASAQGMLLADVRREQVRTLYEKVDTVDRDELIEAYADLVRSTASRLADDLPPSTGEIEVIGGADLRYSGQTYEITLPIDVEAPDLSALRRSFDDAHQARYGHAFPDDQVEIINLRVAALRRIPTADWSAPVWTPRPRRERPVHWGAEGWVDTPIVSRAEVQETGESLQGPMIIEQDDSTIVVPSGTTVDAVGGGCLRLATLPAQPQSADTVNIEEAVR